MRKTALVAFTALQWLAFHPLAQSPTQTRRLDHNDEIIGNNHSRRGRQRIRRRLVHQDRLLLEEQQEEEDNGSNLETDRMYNIENLVPGGAGTGSSSSSNGGGCLCPSGSVPVAGGSAQDYIPGNSNLQAVTNLDNNNVFARGRGRGRGRGSGKGSDNSKDYRGGRNRGKMRKLNQRTRRRRMSYKSNNKGRGSGSGDDDLGRGQQLAAVLQAAQLTTFSNPGAGGITGGIASGSVVSGNACLCVTPDGSVVAGVGGGGILAPGTSPGAAVPGVPVVPDIIQIPGIVVGGDGGSTTNNNPGIFVVSATGSIERGQIPGLFVTGTGTGGPSSDVISSGNVGLDIEGQTFVLDDATVVQLPEGNLQITGTLKIPSGQSGLFLTFQNVIGIADNRGGANFAFTNGRRRRRLGKDTDDHPTEDTDTYDSHSHRHLQLSQATGFVFQTLVTDNPVLAPFGDLVARFSAASNSPLGMAGSTTVSGLPSSFQEYFDSKGFNRASSFFYATYGVASNAASLSQVTGSILWDFLTSNTPFVLLVLSFDEAALLVATENFGFPQKIPNSAPGLGKIRMGFSDGVVGFSYKDALRVNRRSSVGSQFGVLQASLAGNTFLEGVTSVEVTALNNKLNPNPNNAFRLGLSLDYEGRIVTDWDTAGMARNPNGDNGQLDTDLVRNFVIDGTVQFTLSVGIDYVRGNQMPNTSQMEGRSIPLPSCRMSDVTLQYSNLPGSTFGKSIAIASDTPLVPFDCDIKPLSDLLNLNDAKANVQLYLHLVEKSASDGLPEAVVYGAGNVVVANHPLSGLQFTSRYRNIGDQKITIAGNIDLKIFDFDFTVEVEADTDEISITTPVKFELKDPTNTFKLSLDVAQTTSWSVNPDNSLAFGTTLTGGVCLSTVGRRRDRRNLQFGGFDIGGAISNAITQVSDTVNDATGAITSATNTATNVANTVTNTVDAITAATNVIAGTVPVVTEQVTDTVTGAVTTVTTEVTAVSNTLTTVVGDITDTIIDIGTTATDFINNPIVNFCLVTTVSVKFDNNGNASICLKFNVIGEVCFG